MPNYFASQKDRVARLADAHADTLGVCDFRAAIAAQSRK